MKPNNIEFMRSFQKGEKELIAKTMERARSGNKRSDNQMDRPTNKLNSSTRDKGSDTLEIQSPRTLFPLSTSESLTPSGSHNPNQGKVTSNKAMFTCPDTHIPFFNYTKHKQAMDQFAWEDTMKELNIQNLNN